MVHNLVLCAVVGAGLRAGAAGVGKGVWGREVKGGLAVVGLDKVSVEMS